jgi:hypothetical protein
VEIGVAVDADILTADLTADIVKFLKGFAAIVTFVHGAPPFTKTLFNIPMRAPKSRGIYLPLPFYPL